MSIDKSIRELIATANASGEGLVSVENVTLARMRLDDKIAVAIADARREGAEQMQCACADRVEECDQETERWEYAEYIRALPMPTGERQTVLLEDWQLAAAMSEIPPGDELAAGFSFVSWQSGRPDAASALDDARLVQAAVLAANGIGDGNAE